MPFQPRLQRPQNSQGGIFPRLFHRHRTKTPFQGGILFNIFAILFPGGGSQHLQLPTAQGGLEDICSVDSPFRCTGTHNSMHFINEQNHIAVAADFRQHIPQPFLKFAPVFCSRHQAGHIQAHQPFVLQLGRHVAHGHPLGKPFGNGSFTHPRFSNQGRIILVLSAQNADDHIDFLFPSNYRLHGRCFCNQILAELFQQPHCDRLLFPFPESILLPTQIVHRIGKQRIGADTVCPQQFSRCRMFLPSQSQQQMMGLDFPAALLPGFPGSAPENFPGLLGQALGQRQIRCSRTVEQLGHGFRQLRVNPQLPQHQSHSTRLPAHHQQQMLRTHIAVA